MRGKRIERNPRKKAKLSYHPRERALSIKAPDSNSVKPKITICLYRTTTNDWARELQRDIGLKPYHCEKLPAKHVVSYAPLEYRVPLDLLADYKTRLSQVDVKCIELGQKKNKKWWAHRIGFRHRLKNPIAADKYAHQNPRYLPDDDPIIKSLLHQNVKARQFPLKYEVTWVIVSMKPSLELSVIFEDKDWELRVLIKTVPEKGREAIEASITSKIRRAPQIISDDKSKDVKKERGKQTVRYLHNFANDIHKYVIYKTNENAKYNPRRDALLYYIEDHLKQFDVTLNKIFSPLPLKFTISKYQARKFLNKHQSFDELVNVYSPGSADSMS